MKKLVALLLATLMLTLGILGCIPAMAEGESIVRLGILQDPQSFSPFAARSQGLIDTYRTLYEYLVDRDTFGGEMRGCLMKEYEQVDGTTYNLTLYDYIHDTAGNPMKASDVVFSIEKGKESGNLPKLNAIASVEAVGDYTVQFVFAKELAVGELEALWSEGPIVTQASYEASADEMVVTPVGTTAYAMTEYTSGSKIVMTRTGNYWQTDESLRPIASSANVEVIEFNIITEASQRTIAMETGAIDITSGVGAADIGRFSDTTKYSAFPYMENPVNVIYFNMSEGSPLVDDNLRLAIAYAIDSEAVIEGAYDGDGTVCKGLGSSKYGDYIPAWDTEDYFEFDMDKAASLVKESSYNGETLTFMCLNDERIKSLATVVQAYLLQVGINMEIVAYDNAMMTSLETDPTAWTLYMKANASTDYMVNIWKLSWAQANYDGHSLNFMVDDTLEGLLQTCLTPAGHTEENVNAFNQYVEDGCYAYAVNTYNSYVVATPSITSVFQDSRNVIVPGACTYAFQ